MTATGMQEKKSGPRWSIVALLLTVVVLFSALTFFGLSSVMSIDRRAPTASLIEQLQAAIEAYDTEYTEMPDASNNARLIKILSGDNVRKIQFIALRPSQLSSNGQVLDEWGTPLKISIDSSSKIQVMSAGADRIFGTVDDVTSH